MKLDRETVDNVANLARLGLNDQEKERMRDELAPILTYFDMLGELNTEHIPPTAQVITVQNLMRPDEARPSLPNEEALKNAPDSEGAFFRVRAVFGGQ
ncbi:MAG TPA: Asp-tRNA(Asn)/Glu-tRNA(Gln) amidotransferase subunit GatC [Chloroflexia bacterium]|nr:Asp-tRNA(Asn)/Glu-tRNA(Gln) amidotransferase subunit GatC [Chloroflexia bacterium]